MGKPSPQRVLSGHLRADIILPKKQTFAVNGKAEAFLMTAGQKVRQNGESPLTKGAWNDIMNRKTMTENSKQESLAQRTVGWCKTEGVLAEYLRELRTEGLFAL